MRSSRARRGPGSDLQPAEPGALRAQLRDARALPARPCAPSPRVARLPGPAPGASPASHPASPAPPPLRPPGPLWNRSCTRGSCSLPSGGSSGGVAELWGPEGLGNSPQPPRLWREYLIALSHGVGPRPSAGMPPSWRRSPEPEVVAPGARRVEPGWVACVVGRGRPLVMVARWGSPLSQTLRRQGNGSLEEAQMSQPGKSTSAFQKS